MERLRRVTAKLVHMGRADFRTGLAEHKVRKAGELKRTLHAFERPVGISQAPERERCPAMTRNGRILTIGGDQTNVLLRII